MGKSGQKEFIIHNMGEEKLHVESKRESVHVWLIIDLWMDERKLSEASKNRICFSRSHKGWEMYHDHSTCNEEISYYKSLDRVKTKLKQ